MRETVVLVEVPRLQSRQLVQRQKVEVLVFLLDVVSKY
jgi:hypothetical protein